MALKFNIKGGGVWRTMPNGEKIFISTGMTVGQSIADAMARGANLLGGGNKPQGPVGADAGAKAPRTRK